MISLCIGDIAIFIELCLIDSKLSNITKPHEEPNLCNKELAYTVACIGKKPGCVNGKWFTIDKQYTVYKPNDSFSYFLIYDDDGTEWRVSQYDKLMLEAGGYLFGRAKGGNKQ